MQAIQQRRRGRRPPATKTVESRHIAVIRKARKDRDQAQKDLERAKTKLAEKCDNAMKVGVQTKKVAREMGVSRQMLYRFISDRLYGGRTFNSGQEEE